MPSTVDQWVAFYLPSVSWGEISLAVAALLAAGSAVANRAHWCPLQAYAVVLLLALALVLRTRNLLSTTHETVSVRSWAYCVDCKRESRACVYQGACLHKQSSLYEALFPRPVDIWLMIALWAGWVCYGALFHEGQHVHDDMRLMTEAASGTAFSEVLPTFVRFVRVMVLFVFAIFSHFVSDSDTPLHAALVILLALLPDTLATPQALSLLELSTRTLLFVLLFVASEILERVRPYTAYLSALDRNTSVVIVAIQMARNQAMRYAIASGMDVYLQSPDVGPEDTSASPEERGRMERRRTVTSVLARMRSSLRSMWVLISGPPAVGLAVIQILLVLFLLWFQSQRVTRIVRSKSDRFRVIQNGESVPEHRTHSSRSSKTVLPFTNQDLPSDSPQRRSLHSSTSSSPTLHRAPGKSATIRSRSKTRTPTPETSPLAPQVPRRVKRAKSKQHKSPDTSDDTSVPALSAVDQQLQSAVAAALNRAKNGAAPKEQKLQD